MILGICLAIVLSVSALAEAQVDEPAAPPAPNKWVTLLNDRFHRPVLPEDNPWVGLLPLFDLTEWDTGEMAPLGKLLGVDWNERPPGPQLVRWSDWSEEHLATEVLEPGDILEDQPEALEPFGHFDFGPMRESSSADAWYDAVLEGAWTPEQYPEIDRWLGSLDPVLIGVAEALRHESVFLPIPDGQSIHGGFAGSLGLFEMRALARILSFRAHRSIGIGDAEGLRRDITLMLRLADLAGQHPAVINWLVGVSLDQLSYSVVREHMADIPGSATRLLDTLQVPRRRMSHAESIDVGTRLMLREMLRELHLTGEMLSPRPEPDSPELARFQAHFLLPRAEVRIEQYADEVLTILRIADTAQRHTRFAEFATRLEEQAGGFPDVFNLDWAAIFAGRPYNSEAVGRAREELDAERFTDGLADNLADLIYGATKSSFRTQEQSRVMYELTAAGLAVLAHHEKNGFYPAQLGAVTPEFLAQSPRDLDGKPLRYRLDDDGMGFTLYSVGIDEVDDGGVGGPELSTVDGHDVVIRCRR